jgi:hypothetical protein
VLDRAIEELETSLPTIANECRIALAQGAGLYEEAEGLQLQGSWKVIDVVPLREMLEGAAMPRCALAAPATCAAVTKFAAALQKISVSTRALGPHPWLQEARFHLMLPGTHVMQHTAINNQRLKIHCGLRNPDAVELRIANHTLAWQEGRCLVSRL